MLTNYEQLSNGVIKQKNIQKIQYSYSYSDKYNTYGEKGNYLSYLRLGVLLGVLKTTPQSLADIGYGNGAFLRACQSCIPLLYGCDLSEYPVPPGVTKIDMINLPAIDVVCFFDSLEHFDNIYDIACLNTKYIFISVPWCHNHSNEWFKNWYHRRENEHIWHFNDTSLKNFFRELDYTCIYESSFEDTIRQNKSVLPDKNILSCIFKSNKY
jgi:hypothetical protein